MIDIKFKIKKIMDKLTSGTYPKEKYKVCFTKENAYISMDGDQIYKAISKLNLLSLQEIEERIKNEFCF